MAEDEYDLYGDLENFDYAVKIKETNSENILLREQLHLAEKEIESLKQQLDERAKTNEIISKNLSSLIKTARAEIQRKDGQIQELRKEKDNLLFRRKQRNAIQERANRTKSDEKEISTPPVEKLPTEFDAYRDVKKASKQIIHQNGTENPFNTKRKLVREIHRTNHRHRSKSREKNCDALRSSSHRNEIIDKEKERQKRIDKRKQSRGRSRGRLSRDQSRHRSKDRQTDRSRDRSKKRRKLLDATRDRTRE